jgi:pimeloyl-ACP methyl ester carboxylesterase
MKPKVGFACFSAALFDCPTMPNPEIPQDTSQLQSSTLVEQRTGLALHVARQPTTAAKPLGDVLYVHGATFGSDLSVFFRMDGASWADALNAAGFNVWGFDFLGFGRSGREPGSGPTGSSTPLGRATHASPQITQVVEHIRATNGGHPVHMIAHSWGTVAAMHFAMAQPEALGKLVLFGPIVLRNLKMAMPALGPSRLLTVWEQYRRFVEDVPKGQPPVLADRHMQLWADAYLTSDAHSQSRQPPSVATPNGPMADILALWTGEPLYDPGQLKLPTILVRGEWDSVCTDADAAKLMEGLGGIDKQDLKIEKATHLMHLESGRTALYGAANDFLAKA